MYKTIIIDDEEQSRNILREEIRLYCTNLCIAAEANSVQTAVEAIRTFQPDLVFLDIQLTDGTGFTILQQLDKIDFHIIFVTAYNQYGIEALKANATDYILKPIDKEELTEAVQKAEKSMTQKELQNNLAALIQKSIPSTPTTPKKIALSTAEGIHLYQAEEIIRCQSEGNYSTFYFNNGEKLLVAKTMKEIEKTLLIHQFERIHQSHIVNLNHIKRYISKDGGSIVLSDGTELPVAQRKKTRLLSLIK